MQTSWKQIKARNRPIVERLEDRMLLDAGTMLGPEPAPGILDSSFGASGVATLALGPGFAEGAFNAVAAQADGKIVAVGFANTSLNGAHPDFLVARFDADGAPDPSFAVGGFITPYFGDYVATSVAVQPDGKILVTGGRTFENPGGPGEQTSLFIARFDANGSLDSSFGIGGVIQTAISPAGDSASDVLLQPDGKIVVIGDGSDTLPGTLFSQGPLELVRYNADGSLDPSFGSNGIQFVAGVSVDPGNSSVVLQPDGKILVIGRPMPYAGVPAEVLRFDADGTLDQSFGADGFVLFPEIDPSPYFSTGGGEGLAIQADGKILVSTGGVFSWGSALLARLNSDGSLDSSFGNNGEVRANFAGSLAIQPGGQIAVYGWLDQDSNLEIPNTSSGGLASYLPDGQIDSSFKTDGTLALTQNGYLLTGMALQSDGKLIVAGYESSGLSSAPVLARIVADPPSQASQLIVTHLYEDLLGRAPDSTGLYAWAGSLDQKRMTQSQIVTGFLQSTEYHTHTIQALYATYLHRSADPTGLVFWSNYLAAGGTADTIALNLIGSSEYVQLHGGTVGDVVSALFEDLLGRQADPGGAMAWAQAIVKGVPVEVVAHAIFDSDEGARFEVQSLFERLLGRPADAAGSQFFVDALQDGAATEAIIADLASSQEYMARS
jgi:uncharacterized delta-60 repeat protein